VPRCAATVWFHSFGICPVYKMALSIHSALTETECIAYRGRYHLALCTST
jgi:hypothetical protein